MKIGLVGAFDRNNFGDLLMPIVFEKQYNKLYPNNQITFKYYGQLKRNMSFVKSYNTEDLIECYNNCDIVILVGGEILSASYKLMYFNLQKNKFKIFILRCLNKIIPDYIEKYSKKMLKGMENKPWILDKDKLKCKKIIYNTIGGNIKNNKIDSDCLAKADYISIRNKVNYDEIKKINKNTKLYPDSVTMISNLFSEKEIIENVNDDIKQIVKDKYFVVQTDYRNNKGSFKQIAEQIDSICLKYNINCILLPIGYAQGHDDFKALKTIKKYCKCKNVILPRMTNIYETLLILKNSEAFIGTSLHGIIISTSYGIPHMILTNKIKKLLDYEKTWESSSVQYTSIDEMFNNFNTIYNKKEKDKVLKISKKLIDLTNENFDNINSIIRGVHENE